MQIVVTISVEALKAILDFIAALMR